MKSFIPPPHFVLVPLAGGQYCFKTPPISGEVSEGRRGVTLAAGQFLFYFIKLKICAIRVICG